MANYQHKRSSTPEAVPDPSDFKAGEILVNIADGRMFLLTTGNEVVPFSGMVENDVRYIKCAGDTVRGGLLFEYGNVGTTQFLLGFGWNEKYNRFGLDLVSTGDLELHAFNQETGDWQRMVMRIGHDGNLTLANDPTAAKHAATKEYVDGSSGRLVTINDTSNPSFNAQSGRTQVARLTATANRTLQAPSNPVDGQKVIIEHTASGGNRTIGFATGAGAFDLRGKTIEPTASGTTDFFGVVYNASANRWRLIAIDRPE